MLVTLGLTERVKAFTARPHYGEIICHSNFECVMCFHSNKLDSEDNRR